MRAFFRSRRNIVIIINATANFAMRRAPHRLPRHDVGYSELWADGLSGLSAPSYDGALQAQRQRQLIAEDERNVAAQEAPAKPSLDATLDASAHDASETQIMCREFLSLQKVCICEKGGLRATSASLA